jgi:hypothetical protein
VSLRRATSRAVGVGTAPLVTLEGGAVHSRVPTHPAAAPPRLRSRRLAGAPRAEALRPSTRGRAATCHRGGSTLPKIVRRVSRGGA